MNCTLFSLRPSELAGISSDTSLPTYNDATAPHSRLGTLHTLELGAGWSALHRLLGDHSESHPLGFLAAGGQLVQSLEGTPTKDASSGRFFAPILVVQILAAIAQIMQPSRDVERLRVFLAEAVTADRGVVVHLFA